VASAVLYILRPIHLRRKFGSIYLLPEYTILLLEAGCPELHTTSKLYLIDTRFISQPPLVNCPVVESAWVLHVHQKKDRGSKTYSNC